MIHFPRSSIGLGLMIPLRYVCPLAAWLVICLLLGQIAAAPLPGVLNGAAVEMKKWVKGFLLGEMLLLANTHILGTPIVFTTTDNKRYQHLGHIAH